MELTTLLQQIDSLKKEAESLQPVNPDYERVFWDKFRLEFNYNSNHMEGNTLTYGHTQLLLIFGKVTGDYTLRELEEMKAHDAALRKIKEDAADGEFVFTEKSIKDINEIILVEPYYRVIKDGNRKLITPGDYKELPNHVEQQNGEIFYFSQPEETRAHMGDLMDWYRKETETKEMHPVHLAALFHYRFIRIHPFDDGNGRTARLVMNYILLKNGYAPLVIESKDKKNYLTALNKADTGDIGSFVDYIASVSARWQQIYLKAMTGEKIEEPGDLEKEVEIFKKNTEAEKKNRKKMSSQIIDELFSTSILLLIDKVIKKISILDRLFGQKSIQIAINGNSVTPTPLENFPKFLNSEKHKIIAGNDLVLTYMLYDFLDSAGKISNVIFNLKIIFDEYSYEVSLAFLGEPKEIIKTAKYGYLLSEGEIDLIAEKATRKIFNEIKLQ